MIAVIMAGGKGTRIRNVADNIPKPMIEIHGRPVLEHQILCLKEQGIANIILVVGYLKEVIKNYFKDGKKFGIKITYIEESVPLGSAGALYLLKDKIREDFFLINGDIIFDIDFMRFYQFHKKQGGIATLFVHPNSHPYDSAILVLDREKRVIDWLHKENRIGDYKNRVNAGIHIFSVDIFKYITELKKLDLDREVLEPIINTERIYAYESTEYVKDMGTPERYEKIKKDFELGIISQKNLNKKQKAIFLDRDGTVNVYKGFITKKEQIELIEGVADKIKKLNERGYLVIIITNQPVIARGECTLEELEEIHNRIETLLGLQGAYIDDIFFCPHHPDKGFKGERKEYKIQCECRKPKAGLFYQAQKKYNIDLSKSIMIGDSISDIEAGKLAGCRTIWCNRNHVFELETEKE